MSQTSELIKVLQDVHQSEDAWHGPGLRKILAGVDSRQALASPVPGYHSIWEIVLHISHWEEVFCIRLTGKPMEEPEAGDWPAVRGTTEDAWQRDLAFLDQTHDRLIQAVSALTDSDLGRIVAGKPYTASWMIQGSARHHTYHAGQIAVVKRLIR